MPPGRRHDGRPRRRGFVVATSVLGLFLFAAAAPTPLYGDYAARWHFSRISLTAVLAVLTVCLLATLLTYGTLWTRSAAAP